MAYVSKELKAELSPEIKRICKQYGIKATIAVQHHSTLVLNIKSGPIDFISNYNQCCPSYPIARDYMQVNVYHAHTHFDSVARDFLQQVIAAMKGPKYFDHSDLQTDYFNCSHYVSINVGQWGKPYQLVTAS